MYWRLFCSISMVLAIALHTPVSHSACDELVLRPADVVRVYDGDTFYITLSGIPAVLGEEVPVRLLGIDTPEIRSTCPTEAQKVAERALAQSARTFLVGQLTTAKRITLTNLKRDKYFRIDAKVWVDGVELNALMQTMGFAVAYDGETTKPSWCSLK